MLARIILAGTPLRLVLLLPLYYAKQELSRVSLFVYSIMRMQPCMMAETFRGR